MKHTIILFTLLTGYVFADATHIIGSDIRYTCIDSSQHIYQIELSMFRDCLNGQAPFDNRVSLFYFDTIQKTLLKIEEIPFSGEVFSNSPIDLDNCNLPLNNYCSESTVYSIIDTLLPRLGGYSIGWSRCCVPNVTVNGVAQQGITVTAHIPGIEISLNNTQPQFLEKDIYSLCQNEPFVLNMEAVDQEGDSLVYSIHPPWSGLNLLGLGTSGMNPLVDIANPMGLPPYQAFSWLPGYSATDPLGTGFFAIDPQTGKLFGKAGGPGAHLYSIAVEEYRNGISLGHYALLLQFNVVDCGTIPQTWELTADYSTLSINQDTLIASDDTAFCFAIDIDSVPSGGQINLQINNLSSLAELGISQTTTDPLQYEICWTPSCRAWPDTLLPLVLESFPDDDCPLSGFRLDTIYLQLSASGDTVVGPDPQAAFSVSHDGEMLLFQNQSQNAGTFMWDFGDGTVSTLRDPIRLFSASGLYDVQLIVQNDCGSDTISQTVSVILTDLESPTSSLFSVWPNPANNYFRVRLPNAKTEAHIKLFNLQGQECWQSRQTQAEAMHRISGLKSGIYFIEISQAGQSSVQKIIVNQ